MKPTDVGREVGGHGALVAGRIGGVDQGDDAEHGAAGLLTKLAVHPGMGDGAVHDETADVEGDDPDAPRLGHGGGFAKLEAIEQAGAGGVTVYAPVPTPRKEGIDPHQPKAGDGDAVAAWRQRMGTDEAKAIYKQRAATAETVNADLRTWRGLDCFRVRGSGKVRSVVLWSAITYNLMRWIAAGVGT